MMKLAMTTTAALLFALGGCDDAADNGSGNGSAGGDAGHVHDFQPKHGGQIVELGDHEPLVEMVHDDVLGVITLYVFDDHQSPMTIDKAPVFNLSEPVEQVKATGSGSEWKFEHDGLKGHPHGASLRIEIGGKTFNKEWHPPH